MVVVTGTGEGGRGDDGVVGGEGGAVAAWRKMRESFEPTRILCPSEATMSQPWAWRWARISRTRRREATAEASAVEPQGLPRSLKVWELGAGDSFWIPGPQAEAMTGSAARVRGEGKLRKRMRSSLWKEREA